MPRCGVSAANVTRWAQEGFGGTIRLPKIYRPNIIRPMKDISKPASPANVLTMLILRVLQSGALHGYAIAQRIHMLSSELLAVEEGLLYPTLQKMLVKGWVKAEWGVSDTNRKVRIYQLTAAGRKQLAAELNEYEQITSAIQDILRTA